MTSIGAPMAEVTLIEDSSSIESNCNSPKLLSLIQLLEAPVSIRALYFLIFHLCGYQRFSSLPMTTSSMLFLLVSFRIFFSSRDPKSSHSATSLSEDVIEELSPDSISVMFSSTSSSSSSLVSPLSISDTGSILTFGFAV